ncbi:MAG: hypothetical protein WC955_11910 [Elusimicrobiota bacterium]
MLNKFYEKALVNSNCTQEAIRLGLMKVMDLEPKEYRIVLNIAENKQKYRIPDKFLREMPVGTLFSQLPRKEVSAEILRRIKGDDKFELPGISKWELYKIPARLEKHLLPYLVGLEYRTLKSWQSMISEDGMNQVFHLRRKNCKRSLEPRVDPLLVAIKENHTQSFSYFDLLRLKKERFLKVVNAWLGATDEVKIKILKTPYVNLLDDNQYVEIIKSWLKVSWPCVNIANLKLEHYNMLTDELKYEALKKHVRGDIHAITPMPPLEDVTRLIVPKILANNTQAEEVYLKYKLKSLVEDMRKHVNGVSVDQCFKSRDIKQLRVITEYCRNVYWSSQELKYQSQVYEWVLNQESDERSALCKYFIKRGGY